MKTIKVLIVDDSAVVRQVLSEMLNHANDIDVIGVASDPIFAMSKMKLNMPDVIVLDVEMPRMDGISFLNQIMKESPLPVVICSTLTEAGSQVAMQAFAAGAVNVITKPKVGLKNFLEGSSNDIVAAVRAASVAKIGCLTSAGNPSAVTVKKIGVNSVPPKAGNLSLSETTERIVAMGTSTGGTQALESILTSLPRVIPGIVIVQHMPEKFTAAFAQRLNGLCEIEVVEAKHKDRVIAGRVLIAPGGKHMLLKRSGAQYYVEVTDGPVVNRHKPSVDVLFRSVAATAGKNALGIIMTGMGDDGASGLLEMRRSGAYTVAQDEASCVVFGMPKEAIKMGAAIKTCSLNNIPQIVMSFPGAAHGDS